MKTGMKNARRFMAIIAVLAVVVLAFSINSLVEYVEADEIVIIQDPIDGDLHVYTQPGLYS